MSKTLLNKTYQDLDRFKILRDSYKKIFWIKSKSMDPGLRKQIHKQFAKIDRLRNHLTLWLKHMLNKKPSNSGSYEQLIVRGKTEIRRILRQLDKTLSHA